MFSVVVTEKGGSQRKIDFEEESILIGRVQGNQIILPMGNVSKRHAKLEIVNKEFVLTDLGSTNGTYINGRRVNEPTYVGTKDKIYIGDFILGLEGGEISKVAEVPPIPKAAVTGRTSIPPLPRKTVPQSADQDPSAVAAAPEPPPQPEPATGRRTMVSGDETDQEPPSEPGIEPEPSPPSKSDAKIRADFADIPDTKLHKYVGSLVDQVARMIKRVDRTKLPLRLDSATAGQVRQSIAELVNTSVAQGKLPPAIDPDVLRGRAFRSIIDLGPLNVWLDDDEVEMIRVSRSNGISLLKDGLWINAASGFLSDEDLNDVVRCLGAGLESLDAGHPGLARYRLEEGYLALTALPPAALSNGVLMIDKTVGKTGKDAALDGFDAQAQDIIRDAIEARARLGIVGSSVTARLSVVSDIVRALPVDDFVVAIEDLPLLGVFGPGRVRLSTRGLESNGSGCPMRRVLSHALDYESNWLAISGTNNANIAQVLSAAASRLGVVAELPLGMTGALDRELLVACAAGGITVSPAAIGVMLESAFDMLIVIDRELGSPPTIKKIVSSAISDRGQWSPRVLFDGQ